MIEAANYTITYFRAPKNYFWNWADNGTVLQWQNGSTICYRDDLVGLLRQIDSGLPPLSPLLLLLAACERPLHVQDKFFLLREATRFGATSENHSLHKTLEYAFKFLEFVAALPANLRTGQKRIALIYVVFSEAGFSFSNRQLQDAILELNSGRMDNDVFHYFSAEATEEEFTQCLLYFCTALQKFPSVQHLITKLRTGLDQLPEATALLLPENLTLSLYDQLLLDPVTAGIARLAKRLVAALNIPMQSKGSSDQPFGGISDITNRGNYDKLLLSELAYDDELLMARLVNNEALYFRREEPPEKPKTQRLILMDTTIKMWGTARVFALSAGLACSLQNKHSEVLQAYMLGGKKYLPVSLGSKQGIIQALEMLDPALHCGKALHDVVQSIPAAAKNEFIFITAARLLHSAAFHAYLADVKSVLNFVITVTDSGELHLYEYINGTGKMISSAKIDIDEVLAAPAPTVKRKDIGTPAFLLQQPAPLFFPCIRIKVNYERGVIKEGFGVVLINETQRVFFISEKNKTEKAPVELLSTIEKGGYTFGIDSNNEINILVNNQQRGLLKLYKINSQSLALQTFDLSNEIVFAKNAVFKVDKFFILTNQFTFIYDCIAAVVVEKKDYNEFTFDNMLQYNLSEFNKGVSTKKYPLYNQSIFYHVKNIHVNDAGSIVIGKHILILQDKRYISFNENPGDKSRNKIAKASPESLDLLQNKKLQFNVWIWDDGSTAVVDPRGFLHLKSADPSLPEITIVMILDRTTTCWSSDGVACGSLFYINEKIAQVKTAERFYADYIQKFIDRLK